MDHAVMAKSTRYTNIFDTEQILGRNNSGREVHC